jgi:peptidoglycan/LPS O-acetylase OafA/YrhL
MKELRTPLATLLTWLGMSAIFFAAVTTSLDSIALPGTVAAIPVVGAALVIAGGTAGPQWGVGNVLRLPPLRWIGRVSYSWYLWHWAILSIATERTRVYHDVGRNVVLVFISLIPAAATYFLLENPVRHSRWLARSNRACLIGAGVLIASCVAITFLF